MSFVLTYITAKDKDEARLIARNLLEKRLAACVNLLGEVESHYPWNGKIENSKETLLIAKTRTENQEALIKAVEQIHSYECPCILFLPISGGSQNYLNWMSGELSYE